MNPLTYEEFEALAKKYYDKGGNVFYDCWNENTFNVYVKKFGPLTTKKALEIFKDNYETKKELVTAAKFFAGFWA